MSEMDLTMLNKTNIMFSEDFESIRSVQGNADCNDCHYINSDCECPLFCDD